MLHAPPPTPPAIQVLLGAQLWAGDGQALAGQALAIRAGRILAVGPQEKLLKQFAQAKRVDLAGGTLLPGFIEGHAHVESIGRHSRQADLAASPSLDATLATVAQWAQAHPAAWIQGRGWDQNLWPDKTFPNAASLDRVTFGTPAALTRVDGHALWANSAALAAAGITRATPDPAGGSILRDAQGQPTGILLDAATELVSRRIPEPGQAERAAALLDGLLELRRLGFTSVDDMGIDQGGLAAYRALAKAGKLPIRVFAYLSHDTALMLQELRRPRSRALGMFQVQGVKFYMDGALGSRGARMLAPYADAPGVGLWVSDPAKLAVDVKSTLRAGYQVAIHAIGDAANRKALDILARSGAKPELPARIEHAQIVAPADVARFGQLGVVASVQPMHCIDDHAWTPARLGPERAQEAYPWRGLLDGGALLVFGSDGPIADPNPFLGLIAAETRQDAAGDPPGGWLPAQRLSRVEGLRAYTSASARALGHRDLGVLRAGASADLVWVQAPLLTLDAAAVRHLKPARLWVNGTEVAP